MSSDRNNQVIAKLIEETQTDQLKWLPLATDSESYPHTAGDFRIGAAFRATREGRRLRLYERSIKSYTDFDEWHWVETIVLELGDKTAASWWTFPESPLLGDLMRAVQYKVSDVERFFDDLLGRTK